MYTVWLFPLPIKLCVQGHRSSERNQTVLSSGARCFVIHSAVTKPWQSTQRDHSLERSHSDLVCGVVCVVMQWGVNLIFYRQSHAVSEQHFHVELHVS